MRRMQWVAIALATFAIAVNYIDRSTLAVGNVKIEPTATAIRATKQNAGDAKIDPWMAAMDAVTVMSRNPEALDGMEGFLSNPVVG